MDMLRMHSVHATPLSRRPGAGALVIAGLLLLAALALASCRAEDGLEGSPSAPAVSNPSFATDVAPILSSAGCTGCHGSSAPSSACDGCHGGSRVPTDSYMNALGYADMVGITSAAVTGGTVVTSGSSDTSVLYWVVTKDSRYVANGTALNNVGNTNTMLGFMPPPGSGDITTIKNWIDQGAAP